MSKRTFAALSILVLWLGACSVTPYASDPLGLKAAAGRKDRAAAVDIELARQSAALEAERARLALQGTATMQGLEVQATQTAMAAQAQATAYAATPTAQAIQATATAIQARATNAASVEELRAYTQMGWALLPLCSLGVLAVIILTFLGKGIAYYWEAYIRNNSVIERRAGTVAWVEDDNGTMMPVLLGEVLTPPRLPQIAPRITVSRLPSLPEPGRDEVERLTASGSVLASPPVRSPGVRELALDLLWQAQQEQGPTGTAIPGWRRLSGFNSKRWQRVLAALRAAGIAIETTHDGTFLQGVTVGDLHYQIDTGVVKVRPAPVDDDDPEDA